MFIVVAFLGGRGGGGEGEREGERGGMHRHTVILKPAGQSIIVPGCVFNKTYLLMFQVLYLSVLLFLYTTVAEEEKRRTTSSVS